MHLPVDWHALYVNLIQLGTGDQAVSIAEKILRPVVIYLLLVLGLKKLGRRVLAQLNPFDFVVLLTLSNTVQNAIIGNDTSLSGGILGAVALLSINALLVRLFYRGASNDTMTTEDDTVLIRNYEPQTAALTRLHINVGELTARAHERGFDDLSEVEFAVLYPNGTIYMKGESEDSARLERILEQLEGLRSEVASLRR
jgi:uncharacterized membrane protein YcaP (DUF421 family)